MNKFKKGDRVRVVSNNGVSYIPIVRDRKLIGTILAENSDFSKDEWGTCWHIRFDESFKGGHDCFGKCEDGHGQYISECDLELVSDRIPIGTKVRVINSDDGHEDEIGVVKDDDKSGYPYWVVFGDDDEDDEEDGEWLRAEDFEIIIETTKRNNKTSKQSQTSSLSYREMKILNDLTGYNYIARDYDNKLFAYKEKPTIDIGGTQFYSKSPYKEVLQNHLFKFIKWENSPVEINKLIKGGKNE